MDRNIIEEIVNASSFQEKIFDDLLLVEGRVLSPSEVESAGLASALLASAIFKGKNKEQIEKTQRIAEKVERGELDDIDELMQLTSSISPDQMERIAEREDRLLIRCIRRCSRDNGESWEPLHLVSGVDQQNAKLNKLWIGMISSEDRRKILNRAMNGHREASERLKSFRAR